MSEKSTNQVALSVVIVVVTLLAGYVVFEAFQKPPSEVGAVASTPAVTTSQESQGGEIDAVFVIDATSSMADEIEQVRTEVVSLAERIEVENPEADIRFGIVLFKDLNDDFLTEKTPLTSDSQKIRMLLTQIEVSGGGDYPEHVGAGLHEALKLDWRDDARRIVYLVGDAPPQSHGDGLDVGSAVEKARQMGVTIRALGCSGIETQGGRGRDAFARIASQTGGTYRNLTYHAVIEDQDGTKRSVIFEGGEAYEADRVLEDDEWAGGSAGLKDKGVVRKARPASRNRASGAKKKSNVVEIIEGDFLLDD